MGPHDVYDYGNIDEAIIGHIGAAIYDNGPLAQPNASAGSNRANHELFANDYHGEPSSVNLPSPFHNADPLPEGFELDSQDAPVFRDESTPWHPAWACETVESHLQGNEPLAPTSQTDVNSGCDPDIDPSRVCEACDAREAHSSMNGITEWPDFSKDDDLPECSCTDLPTDNTSSVPPSSSAQLVSVELSQSLSPATSMSQQDTQAGVAAGGEIGIDNSSPSSYIGPARPLRRGEPPHVDEPIQSFASDGATVQVSVSPSNNASVSRPHLCSFCSAGFRSRSDVMHHERLHDPNRQNAQRCPECDYTCQFRKDMRRHQETHLAERGIHLCPEENCSRSFTRKDNAMRHVRKKHTPQVSE